MYEGRVFARHLGRRKKHWYAICQYHDGKQRRQTSLGRITAGEAGRLRRVGGERVSFEFWGPDELGQRHIKILETRPCEPTWRFQTGADRQEWSAGSESGTEADGMIGVSWLHAAQAELHGLGVSEHGWWFSDYDEEKAIRSLPECAVDLRLLLARIGDFLKGNDYAELSCSAADYGRSIDRIHTLLGLEPPGWSPTDEPDVEGPTESELARESHSDAVDKATHNLPDTPEVRGAIRELVDGYNSMASGLNELQGYDLESPVLKRIEDLLGSLLEQLGLMKPFVSTSN